MYKEFNIRRYIIYTTILFLLIEAGCATYYQKNQKFQQFLESGEIESANALLEKDTKTKEGRNQLLFYFNRGVVSWMLGNYSESTTFFAKADLIVEDYHKNYGMEALALISNPSIKPYKPEDFEGVMLYFYQAMNYISLGKYTEAIVECRRVNIRLNELNDKYKDYKNRYQQDAFAHTLMGLVYDANNDFNNAFIAYRNALEIYEKDYQPNFQVGVPEQLKWDLLRSAYRTGFYEEVDFYEKKFGLKYTPPTGENGDLVFFWLNGFGPVKSEWSINFAKQNGQNGWINFVSEEEGITFPFYIGDKDPQEKNALAGLSLTRVAFPKYVERKPVYTTAEITANGSSHTLQLAQDINAIAFKTLRDRLLREMSTALLRVATKKAMELALQKQNQEAGAAVGIVNALTEKADTRNWQSLPYSISYARISMPVGDQNISLQLNGNGRNTTKQIPLTILNGKTTFYAFHSLESLPAVY